MKAWGGLVNHVRWAQSHRLVLQLTATAVVLIQVTILFQAASRGLDYLALPDTAPTVAALATVERIISLKASGWIFFVGALLGYVGMLTRRVPLAAMAHMVVSICYATFAIGALVEVYAKDGELFGWRTGTSWVTAAVLHAVFAVASEYSWRAERAE